MRNLEKGQHIFIAFQDGKAVLDSQLRPRIYTSLENAEKWTPTVNKGKIEYVEYASTLTPPNDPLTLEQLREMDGEPVWVEDVKHWALIDIEKGGQWDGVPFAIWAENGMKFTYNIKNRGLHCYRRPPEGEADETE